MAKITLPKATWLCVNPGAAYSSGVEVTINVEKTTANIRYEFTNSNTIAPTYINDISEPVQSLSVKAVDGKGFLWLLSQSIDVEVQIETITPATSVVSVPSNLAKETKQDTQILETQTLNSNLGTKADSAASSDTGTFSLISLIKRSLQNWTTFLNRMPSKGQTVAANSLPVVLPADQITAITPPTTIGINNFPATQPISALSLPLPNNAATLPEQQAQTLEIKKISKRAAFAVMQDVSGVKFIRVINDDNTTRDFALDGTAYAPAMPVSAYVDNQSIAVVGYVAKTANAPLYLIGDVIYNVLVSTETGVVSGWFNNKTGTYVTPNMAHLELQAATDIEQKKQTTELTLANELAYREATKTYTTLKTWAQYKVVDITGWSVGVVVGDFVYKEINKLTNALQWRKSDGVTTIAAPANEDVNVDQLTGDREISVVYSSVFGAVSKTRAPTIKNGIYNFGTVETEGSWV